MGTRRKWNGTQAAGRPRNVLPPIETMVHRLAAAGVSIDMGDIRAEVAAVVLAARTPKGKDWVQAEVERRHRKAVFAAARRLGLMQVSQEYPVDMLHAAGHLAGPDEDEEVAAPRAEAAARFAALHWRLFGYPGSAQDNGYKSPLNEEEIQAILDRAKRLNGEDPMTEPEQEWLTEARHKTMRLALMRRGHHVTAITLAVVCGCVKPRYGQLDALRIGLQALADAPLPTRRDVPVSLQWAS